MIYQRHPQFRGGAAGLVGEAGVRADDGVRGGIESAGGVGLLDGRVANGLRIEFALDHGETGGGVDEKVGSEVAGTTDAAGSNRRR